MGVESKLCRFAHGSTDCCKIETRVVLSTGGGAIATGCDDNAELISSAHNLGQF
jgi:hypothetical protein